MSVAIIIPFTSFYTSIHYVIRHQYLAIARKYIHLNCTMTTLDESLNILIKKKKKKKKKKNSIPTAIESISSYSAYSNISLAYDFMQHHVPDSTNFQESLCKLAIIFTLLPLSIGIHYAIFEIQTFATVHRTSLCNFQDIKLWNSDFSCYA